MSNTGGYDELRQLGSAVELPASPEQAVLESVANPQPDVDYCVRFSVPEFTSLCPLTGQPDFAHLVIDYVPARRIVESKSLKLYLASWDQEQILAEDLTNTIADDLAAALGAHATAIAVTLHQHVRGGIDITVRATRSSS